MSAQDIERLATLIEGYVDRATEETIVRTILTAMREPSEELCEVGMEYTADPCWARDVGRAFTAMIDHMLAK